METYFIRVKFEANALRAMCGLPVERCTWNYVVQAKNPSDAIARLELGSDCVGVECHYVHNDRRN